jgi:hypothetical protein
MPDHNDGARGIADHIARHAPEENLPQSAVRALSHDDR